MMSVSGNEDSHLYITCTEFISLNWLLRTLLQLFNWLSAAVSKQLVDSYEHYAE